MSQLDERLRAADPASPTPPAQACQAAVDAAAIAQTLDQPIEQARASAWICTHLLRQGQHAEVMRHAPAVLPMLQVPELRAELVEVLRMLTLAGCEAGAFDVALDAAHELVRITAGSGEDGPALSAAFSLAACFERMGDSWQAVRVLTKALRDHGGGAPEMPLLVAANGLCAISIGILHRMLGIAPPAEVAELLAQARAAGERARAMLPGLQNPAYEVAVAANLGEVMLYQGEAAAAEPMLREAAARGYRLNLLGHAWRVHATLCAWHLAAGQPAAALAETRSLLAAMGAEPPPQTAVRVHHVAYRACRELARFEEALAHFEELERIERRRALTQLRAQSQLFVTRTEVQHAQWQAEQAQQAARAASQRAAELAERAECDPLTGLGNRRHLERRAAELLPLAQRDGRALALAQVDIDHFKSINDRHGHAAGDRVLVALAELLRENTRAADVLVRHGGEEFVIVLPDTTLEGAAEICERLRERVAEQRWPVSDGIEMRVTISIGLASTPPHTLPALLEQADAALYLAKRAGRNRLRLAA